MENTTEADLKKVTCPCGHEFFRQFYVVREVSAIQSRTGQIEYVPIPVLVCVKCDKMLERPKQEEKPLIVGT
jgi:hypothetical protein